MNLKRQKKILMISSSSALGGGTKHMFMLGESLKKDLIIFYAIPKNNNFSKYLNSGNHIYIAERKICFRDFINLIRFIKQQSIDIIHAHGKGAGVLGRFISIFSKKPLIYTFHGIHLKCHKWHQRYLYVFYEFVFGNIDIQKILVSKSERDYAKSSKIFLGKNSIIINNGVSNMRKKESLEISDSYEKNLEPPFINVISICRYVAQKNIKEMILIAELLPLLNFSIIGDGPLWDEINFLIRKKKIKNVKLLGEKQDVFKYLYSSDIYLSSSLYEGLPISILEAMSVGLPIVASNVIGNCDTIENLKSGFLYNLKEIDEAANYLNKLANSKKLRKKIGEAAFNRQRKFFSKDLMIKNYLNVYKDK